MKGPMVELRAILLPLFSLWFRLKRGEAVLIVVNTSWAWFLHSDNLSLVFAISLFSTLVLAQLYGLNDVIDAEKDLNDPDKVNNWAGLIHKQKGRYLFISILWAIALLLLAGILFNPEVISITVAMILINTLYSLVFKSIPVIDIIWVILWGMCFLALTGFATEWLEYYLVIGLMTGISHVWQILRDKHADNENSIKTTANLSIGIALVLVSICCLVLAFVVFRLSNVFLALACMLPMVIYRVENRIRHVWVYSKIVFGLIWLYLLYGLYTP